MLVVIDDAIGAGFEEWSEMAEEMRDALDTADSGAAKTKKEKVMELIDSFSDEEKATFLSGLVSIDSKKKRKNSDE